MHSYSHHLSNDAYIFIHTFQLCGEVFLLFYELHYVVSFELYFFEPVIEQILFISSIVTTVGTLFVAVITYLCWCIIYVKHTKKFRVSSLYSHSLVIMFFKTLPTFEEIVFFFSIWSSQPDLSPCWIYLQSSYILETIIN